MVSPIRAFHPCRCVHPRRLRKELLLDVQEADPFPIPAFINGLRRTTCSCFYHVLLYPYL